jgi:hypothetical protein
MLGNTQKNVSQSVCGAGASEAAIACYLHVMLFENAHRGIRAGYHGLFDIHVGSHLYIQLENGENESIGYR